MRKKQSQLELPLDPLESHLNYLKLPFLKQNYTDVAKQAAKEQWSHMKFLTTLVEGEAEFRRDRATERRIRQARFPVVKTLDGFLWNCRSWKNPPGNCSCLHCLPAGCDGIVYHSY